MIARRAWPALLPPVLGLLLAASAGAAGGISVTRGPDTLVFGNCVPSLLVENGAAETIDYLQVDLALLLGNGQERIVELKSAYREGVLHPVPPGGRATLTQHLDTSLALGAPCGEVKGRRVVATVCEAAGGRSCAGSVTVRP
ncbi:MAG: hypothetical protein U1E23_04485 [Reyranellaceae bacterium]